MRIPTMKSTAAVSMLLMLAACATVTLRPTEAALGAKAFAPPSPDRGVIYVARGTQAYFGSAVLIHVLLDGKRLGSLAPGTFWRLELTPGLHEIETVTNENESNVPVDLKNGETHFIKASIGAGLTAPRFNLAELLS